MKGPELKERLKKLELTHNQFANQCGVTKVQVSKWANDHSAIPPYSVVILLQTQFIKFIQDLKLTNLNYVPEKLLNSGNLSATALFNGKNLEFSGYVNDGVLDKSTERALVRSNNKKIEQFLGDLLSAKTKKGEVDLTENAIRFIYERIEDRISAI